MFLRQSCYVRSLGWPWIHYVAQAGLEFTTSPPASASQVDHRDAHHTQRERDFNQPGHAGSTDKEIQNLSKLWGFIEQGKKGRSWEVAKVRGLQSLRYGNPVGSWSGPWEEPSCLAGEIQFSM